MAEEQTEEEPSIEEILDSIRQIITDDDEEETPSADGDDTPVDSSDDTESEVEAFAPDEIEASSDDDVLELTDKVEDGGEDAQAQASTESSDTDDDFSIDMVDDNDIAETPEEPDPVAPSEPQQSVGNDASIDMVEDAGSVNMNEEILTHSAEEAVASGFSELAKKTAVNSSGPTIEAMVRGELRPLLRDWLDKNLPSMIERLVQEELDKISKRAMDDE